VSIKQGDVYWIDLGEPEGSEPGYRHPHVVVQNNVFNHSRINTLVLCALTSNLKRASVPGNVLLKKGEANLKKDSVVNVSQIVTVDKSNVLERIGTLSASRVKQIVAGVKLLIEPREAPAADLRT
jgi:mRNA interferase MazF